MKFVYTPAAFAAELGARYGISRTQGAIQRACREKRLVRDDLNEGTGKRPRYRIPLRELKRIGEAEGGEYEAE